MLKPIISWKYMGTGRPGDKRRKAGIIITGNFDAIKNFLPLNKEKRFYYPQYIHAV